MLVIAGHLVEAEELVMPKEGSYARPAGVVQIDRRAGQNDVGVVAWLLMLKTPECPQGRQVPSFILELCDLMYTLEDSLSGSTLTTAVFADYSASCLLQERL